MRMRPKRFRAAVVTTDTPGRPIRLCLGPALGFDLELGEARRLAWALADAIEQAQRGGGDNR